MGAKSASFRGKREPCISTASRDLWRRTDALHNGSHVLCRKPSFRRCFDCSLPTLRILPLTPTRQRRLFLCRSETVRPKALLLPVQQGRYSRPEKIPQLIFRRQNPEPPEGNNEKNRHARSTTTPGA